MPSKIKPEDRTPYVKLMVERFESIAHPKDGSECAYETLGEYLGIINLPRAYGVEDEMLDYALAHENAPMKELLEYFDSLAECHEPVEDPNDEDNEWLDEKDS